MVILKKSNHSSLLALVSVVAVIAITATAGTGPAGMPAPGSGGVLGIRPRVAPFPAGMMRLRLRGGMWYSGEDDSEDSYYDDGDDDDDDDDEEGSEDGKMVDGEAAGQGGPSPRVEENNEEEQEEVFKGDGYVVPDENGSIVIPLGSWNAGRFRDIFERRYINTNRDAGPLPCDDKGVTIIKDYYGLGNYTILGHEEPDDPEYHKTLRSLLKVPIEDLPEPFHWLTGAGDQATLQRQTLAERFSQWEGPAPDTWQARCDSPRGAVMAYSASKDVNHDNESLDEMLGGRECGAFFRHATEERYRKGNYQLKNDGSFWAGPDWVAPNDTICDTARPDLPYYAVLPQASVLRQKHIGQESFVFQAVEEAEFLEELLISGVHEWGRASEETPANFIDVKRSNFPLFLRGSNQNPVTFNNTGFPLHSNMKPWGVDSEGPDFEFPDEIGEVEKWDADHAEDEEQENWIREDPQSVLSGQWRLSNSSYGSFSNLQMIYHTDLVQPVIQAFSGPWIIDHCDVRCSASICLQVLYGGLVDVRHSAIGGTGREYCPMRDFAGVALIGCDVDGDGNLTMYNSIVEDVGWHGGAGLVFSQESNGFIHCCKLQRCRTAVYVSTFCDVTLKGCSMLHNVHGAFVSFCYWMPYDDVPENFDDVVKEAVYGENEPPEFRPSKGLSLDELLERGRAGTLRIKGCEVFGKAWADEARPVVFEHDGGSELDKGYT